MKPDREDQFLDHIRAYTEELVDHVASPAEWEAFKRAMGRWLAEQDAEHREGFDQAAVESEWDDG